MAIVTINILGTLHGKIGGTIFRERYGRQFAHPAPAKHKMSMSAAFKNEQSKFGLTVCFAKMVNGVEQLSNIWRTANVLGVNCYQKIIKNNLTFSTKDSLTKLNIITPAGIDNASISDVSFGNNSIKFLVSLKSQASRNFFKQGHIFFAILFLNTAKKSITSPNEFVVFKKEYDSQSTDTFEVELAGNTSMISKYHNGLLFTAAVLVQPKKSKVFWTSTAALEIAF